MIKSHKNATLAFIYVNIWQGIFLFIFITNMTRSAIVYIRMCVAVHATVVGSICTWGNGLFP